ncbi:MAG TPA: YmdB family metallophosphoesterase, partial [Deinococcales bacterium]|nr:YmdB family metallophosphoesterase [Deinococcales bacterium]
MRILFIGDIFGRPGREITARYLRENRDRYDLVIANGENATSGRGLNRRHYRELRDAGIDLITLGNHTWDQADTAELLEESPRLLRAANYPAGTPGLEVALLETAAGKRLAVVQLLGRVFMNPVDDPFAAADRII